MEPRSGFGRVGIWSFAALSEPDRRKSEKTPLVV